MSEKVRLLLWFFGRFSLWFGASVAAFEWLSVMTPILLYISALVGFMLVAEYSEPALSEAGLRGGTWAVTLVGFALFAIWMAQWILAELEAMLAQTP
jgi:uncharacterized membrane protein YkvI